MRMALNLLISVVVAYCAVLALVFFFQSRLVFYPEIGREATITPQTYGLKFESVNLPTADGETLHAWWVPAEDARGTALFFHGNAGNISHRLDYLQMLNRMHFSTFIVDYRGYGRSTGKPSVEGTYRDAEAAWDYLRGARSVKPADLVIVGESLGGAIASWLAVRVPPRALVLVSTFTSATDLGAQIYWFLPVRLLSRLDYDSARNLREIRVPIFIAHSRDDDVIPFSHGRKLYELAAEPKVFLEMQGGHNEGFVFSRPEWSAQLAAFLDRYPAR